MHDDDDRPKPKPARLLPPILDGWSVEELADYIAELRTEISRAEAMSASKQTHRSAADAFFRKP